MHATDYLGFRPVSEAMSNLRFTLRRLRRLGLIERPLEAQLVAGLKAKHFSGRTREQLSRLAAAAVGASEASRILRDFAREYVDVKAQDAQALLAYLARPPAPRRRTPPWRFPATAHWRRQFVDDLAQIPPLS